MRTRARVVYFNYFRMEVVLHFAVFVWLIIVTTLQCGPRTQRNGERSSFDLAGFNFLNIEKDGASKEISRIEFVT